MSLIGGYWIGQRRRVKVVPKHIGKELFVIREVVFALVSVLSVLSTSGFSRKKAKFRGLLM